MRSPRLARPIRLFLGRRPYAAVVAKDEPTWLPVTCTGCPHRWYGIERAHCTCCHRTFADVDLFDRHRVDHGCRNPTTLSMIKHAQSGVWEPRPVLARRRQAG
jgi:hypothetical protein